MLCDFVFSSLQAQEVVHPAADRPQAVQAEAPSLPPDDPRDRFLQETSGFPGHRPARSDRLFQVLQAAKLRFRGRSCQLLPAAVFFRGGGDEPSQPAVLQPSELQGGLPARIHGLQQQC